MDLGEKIQSIRKSKNITQEELADKIGVKRSVISKYENNSVSISIETLSKIAKVLDVSIQSFFESKVPLETTANFLKYATENNVELVRKPTFDERVMNAFKQVNDNGREKIAEYAEDIASNPKYKI